ncbi:MAG: FAD-dependent oxidoreductase [Janthinobacterium lividum]
MMTSLNPLYTTIMKDLYTRSGLQSVDQAFLEFLKHHHLTLYQELTFLRISKNNLENKQLSHFILDLAPWIEKFLTHFFNLDEAMKQYQTRHVRAETVAWVRKHFIQKRIAHRYTDLEAQQFDPKQLESIMGSFVSDLDFAQRVQKWLDDEPSYQDQIQAAIHYAAWAIYTSEGRHQHAQSVLFSIPEKLNYDELLMRDVQDNISQSPWSRQHKRSNFNHYAPCPSQTYAVREATYCLYCHHQEKDSCSQGLRRKGEERFQINSLENILTGCPLNQKISEMNQLYAHGQIIGALAAITLDNPLVAATGYRICNDCSKACIFQKQEPVDIPAIETRILQDVLTLPWGFEIYSLLTRWNPLNLHQPLPKEPSGHRVLVVGLGPAGFTLAHYLLNEGHDVVAIDGQKIESLPAHYLAHPIQEASVLSQPLEERLIGGFGGVAEYGITSRWDKNNLTLIRLLLERRPGFQWQGNTRFGAQITQQSAFDAGFDHIALCTGAGKPVVLNVPNRFAPGVHLASDFLMALHLQSFYRPDALVSFNIEGPIVVIGGGLTAIDTATESLACEQRRQHQPGVSQPSKASVKIVYRKRLQEAPAYRLNHAEVQSALDQGVEFCENSVPLEILIDDQGRLSGLKIRQGQDIKVLEAKTILIATGTSHSTFDLSENLDQARISIFGDMDTNYAGSVVKAMASAKEGAPRVTQKMTLFSLQQNQSSQKSQNTLLADLTATVVHVQQLSPQIHEIVIHAPAAVRAFQPGQFFRLQNFADTAPVVEGNPLLMKGVALRGVWRDIEKGWLGFVIQEAGPSTRVAALLQAGQKVSLMGPVGQPIDISDYQNVMLIGEDLGTTALLSVARALADRHNHVTYVASYASMDDVIYRPQIEAVADQIIWCAPHLNIEPKHAQDLYFQGTSVDALIGFADQKLIDLSSVDRFMVAGSNTIMAAFQKARLGVLKPYLKPNHEATALVNTRMQCMMQGICGQCIQRKLDPDTGQEQLIFACIQSHQKMETIDFESMSRRLCSG